MSSQHPRCSPHPEVTELITSLPRCSEWMQPACERLNTKGRSWHKHCSKRWRWQAGIRGFLRFLSWCDAGMERGTFMLLVSPAGPEAWAGGEGDAGPLPRCERAVVGKGTCAALWLSSPVQVGAVGKTVFSQACSAWESNISLPSIILLQNDSTKNTQPRMHFMRKQPKMRIWTR